MLRKLQKKYKTRCIIGAVLLFVAAALMFLLVSGDIKDLLEKPQNLDEIQVSDLKDGLRVKGSVDVILDYYCYTEQDGKTIAMEFLVSLPEGDGYIGMECSGSKMKEAEASMDALWDYLDEVSDEYENMESVKVNGTIKELTGDSKRYFNEYLDSLGWSDSELEIFQPYVLKVGTYGDASIDRLVFCGILGLVMAALGIWLLISGLNGKNLKVLKPYLQKFGNEEYAMDRLERFYEGGTAVQGIRMNEDLLLAVNGTTVYFAETSDLLWAYMRTVTHRVNFIPTGKTYSIVLRKKNGQQVEIPVIGESGSTEALNYIAANAPYLLLGYDQQIERTYKKNRDELIRAVDERKRNSEYLQENSEE